MRSSRPFLRFTVCSCRELAVPSQVVQKDTLVYLQVHQAAELLPNVTNHPGIFVAVARDHPDGGGVGSRYQDEHGAEALALCEGRQPGTQCRPDATTLLPGGHVDGQLSTREVPTTRGE